MSSKKGLVFLLTSDWSLWKRKKSSRPRYVRRRIRVISLVKRTLVRVVWHCYEPLINVRNRVWGKSLQVARTTSIVLDEEEATCASHGKWYLFKLFFFIHGASWNWKCETSLAVTKATGRNTFVEGKPALLWEIEQSGCLFFENRNVCFLASNQTVFVFFDFWQDMMLSVCDVSHTCISFKDF